MFCPGQQSVRTVQQKQSCHWSDPTSEQNKIRLLSLFSKSTVISCLTMTSQRLYILFPLVWLGISLTVGRVLTCLIRGSHPAQLRWLYSLYPYNNFPAAIRTHNTFSNLYDYLRARATVHFRELEESKHFLWNLSARHDWHSIKLFDKVDRWFFFEKGKL